MFLLLLLYYIIAAEAASISNNALPSSVCQTTACNNFAHSLLSNMNNSVDPCTDFYGYVCGSWAANNPIPPNEISWSVDHELSNQTYLHIKEVLEEESEYDNLPPIKMAKQYYRSCLDEDAIEKKGLEPMQFILNATGGWPIIMSNEEWETTNATWQEIDNIYITMFGGSCFFKLLFIPDEENSTRDILVINKDLDYPVREKVSKTSESPIDVTHIIAMTKVVIAFTKDHGVKISPKELNEHIVELYFFEKKLEKITEQEKYRQIENKRKDEHVKMTIAELQEYYDSVGAQEPTAKIDWLRTMQSIFEISDITITDSEPVVVHNKHLLHELALLLNSTAPHILVNYVQWNMVAQFLKYLNRQMRNIDYDMRYSNFNMTEKDPRWKTCIEDMPMKDATSYLFVKKYLSTDTIRMVTEMIENMKVEMKARVSRSTWTDDSTKKFMIDKMDNVLPQVGYPTWYDNQTAFIGRYKGLKVGDDYFENVFNNLVYENKRYITDFRKPNDRNEWLDYPITINSFYEETSNAMVIPAAEMQDPYFTLGMPLAVNYGQVGFTIGHELAHSFDTVGIQFDKVGNKFWHNNETGQAYEERAQCFVDQYNNFTLDVTDDDGESIQIDGELTKDENIADTIGLQIAFTTFQKHKMLVEPQTKLPGLTHFSDEQLFFLSYVHAWCSTAKEDFERDHANTDEHSPPKFRMIGSLTNTKSFSRTFNCPMNSPMNPELKCSLWK